MTKRKGGGIEQQPNSNDPMFSRSRLVGFSGLRHWRNRFSDPEYADTWRADVLRIVNKIENIPIGRRRLLKGFAVASLAAGAIFTLFETGIIDDLIFRAEFSDVWDEVNGFMNPPSTQYLLDNCYNPNGSINLTPEQLSKVTFYQFGDSMNLVDGKRQNSKGTTQQGSSGSALASNLSQLSNQIGLNFDLKNMNYAQPGASTFGLIGYESPEGNVQLGATTTKDMADDNAKDPIPVNALLNDEGIPIVILSMNGDDWRNAVDLALNYMNDKNFRNFIAHPSHKTLTADGVAPKIRAVLETYQSDRIHFRDNYAKALKILEDINQIRKDKEMEQIRVIAPLPINLAKADNAPYAQLGSRRGTDGGISLNQYPQSHTAAYRVTSSIYEFANAALKDFAERSGIVVITKPLLDLASNKSLFNDKGHFNKTGERTVGNLLTQLFAISGQLPTGDQISVTFSPEGKPLVVQQKGGLTATTN